MIGRGAGGFTLLELLMAMVIGSIVIAGGFGLVLMTERMDRGFSDRLETTMQLGFVQRTVSRAMQLIVVAPAGYDPESTARATAEETQLMELYASVEDREEFFEGMRELNAAEREPLDSDVLDELAESDPTVRRLESKPAPARFRMGHINKNSEWEYRGEDAAEGVRRVEMLLVRAPFGDQTRGAPVRAAFDLIPVPSFGEERWRLVWTPIVPAGKPTVLLDDLVLAEWSATDSRGQFDDFAAYEESDLPWALRLIMWTADGVKVDWMFDFGAASSTVSPL